MGVARHYVSMGQDIEEKQQLLNGAASVWNIACSERKERGGLQKKYAQIKRMNPHQTKQDYRDTEEDLKLLIKEKDRLYPDDKVQVAHAEVKEIGEKNHVTGMSIRER